MIFSGLLHFGEAVHKTSSLFSIMESCTKKAPETLKKSHFTLLYHKLSPENNFDEVQENAFSILIGRLFDKGKDIDVLSNIGILKNAWGKYIYVNYDEKNDQFDVVLDTVGGIPFFYHSLPNGDVLFSSEIEFILKFLEQKPDYNWPYLNSYLLYGNSSSTQTPFKNISELPSGCSLKVSRNEIKTAPFWDPLSTYRPPLLNSNTVNVLQNAMKLWIEPYENICVSLSGGLDSSALMYCLKDIKKEDQKLTALNYFHSSVNSSNELKHARMVCEETGVRLMELDATHFLPFDRPTHKRLLKPNKPFPGLMYLRWQEALSENIPAQGSCIFLSGHGSDQIFMRPPSKKSYSDYLIEKGLKGSQNILDNLSRYYRVPAFSILKENANSLISYFFKGLKNQTKNILPPWMSQEIIENSSPVYKHPIYDTLPCRMLPGKYDQISALLETIGSTHMEREVLNSIHYPFLFEPVIEFALSYPSYDLFDKGYDRYPLRQSVCKAFNTQMVWRRDKGQVTGLLQLGVKRNLDYVLNTCLEGVLVKKGLLDKNEFHKTIMQISNGDSHDLFSFMYVISMEMFLKSWEN